MPTIVRLLAVLHLSARAILMAAQAAAIVAAMTGNTHFPDPIPALDLLVKHLEDLDAALALPNGKGVAAVRKAAKLLVLADLQMLRAVVQAAADANPSLAGVIIESAGMSIRKVTSRQKNVFGATWGDFSGVVLLVAAVAARNASYRWQMSTDQINWVELPQTTQASTTVSGLTPATTCYFRYRAVTRKGTTDWSQIISILVK
jgi:hypothetical protein